jgi:hypothetical protein
VIAGCASGGHDSQSQEVSRAKFHRQWPFTISRGTLICDGSGGMGAVVLKTPDGTTYAINGIARGERYTYDGSRPVDFEHRIWRNDPHDRGLKVDVGPIIAEGLSLCK